MTHVALGCIIGLMPEEQESLERAITGALRATIKDHGPITAAHIGSAVKRIIGQLANAKLDGLARVLARRRWVGVPPEERTKAAKKRGGKGGTSAWSGMSKAARSAEMKRRAAVRAANREAKS